MAADNSWRTLKALLLLSFALAMTGVVARNHAPDKGRRGNAAQTLSPRFKKLNEIRLLLEPFQMERYHLLHLRFLN